MQREHDNLGTFGTPSYLGGMRGGSYVTLSLSKLTSDIRTSGLSDKKGRSDFLSLTSIMLPVSGKKILSSSGHTKYHHMELDGTRMQ